MKKLNYREWAELIAGKLTDEELDGLTAAMDGDVGNDFYHHLNRLNVQRNPAGYSMALGTQAEVDAHAEAAVDAERSEGITEEDGRAWAQMLREVGE